MELLKKRIRCQLRYYRSLALLLGLACVTGALCGGLDAVYGLAINLFTAFRERHLYWLLPLLPVGGLAIRWLYRRFGKECLHGMELVFEVDRGRLHAVPLRLIPLAVGSTWLTHLLGGSVGREGVAVQMSATVASTLGGKLPQPYLRRRLLLAGVAAGFGGLFRTPITAVFFSMELFHAGAMEYEALLPALVASFTASWVSGLLGLPAGHFAMGTLPVFTVKNVALLLALCALFGLVGTLFVELLHLARRLLKRWLPSPYARVAVVGSAVALVGLLTAGRYNGVGESLLEAALTGGTVYGWDWIAKLLLTVACLAAGYQGGEVMPLLTLGATLGAVTGPMVGFSPVFGACLGYVAVFGAGTNTLLTPIMLGVEVFGPQYLGLFLLIAAVAYTCNGNKSIFPQVRVSRNLRPTLHRRAAGPGNAPAQEQTDAPNPGPADLPTPKKSDPPNAPV